MTSRRDRRARMMCALLACFCAGALVDAWLLVQLDRPSTTAVEPAVSAEPTPVGTSGVAADARLAGKRVVVAPKAAAALNVAPTFSRSGALRVPIDGVRYESFKGGFSEMRDGRPHEAVDILAPRNTPVHAVQDGTIAKLFVSKAGGNTIYQFDPDEWYCYYYAHLERYADGLVEGQHVSQGDVIGYVGTSGNAPAGTPHLHFAVFEVNADKHWWQGKAVDAYDIFRR